jgi:hypothetical protein
MKTHPLLVAAVSAAMVVACRGRQEQPEPAQTNAGRVPSEAAADRAPGPPSDEALVRVVQAIPEVPAADVYAGNKKEFADVSFGTVTPYKPVAEEHFVLVLRPAGEENGKPMIEARQGVAPGQRYTIVSMPDRDGAARINVVSDDEKPPAEGKAKVRIIHADPQAGTAELVATDDTQRSLAKADYGASLGYREVDPTSASMTVRPRMQKGKESALLVEPASLEAGKLYTLVVAPGAEPGKPVAVITIEDSAPVTDDGVHELFPSNRPSTEREQSYEIHPDTDTLPAQKEAPQPDRK